MMVISNGQTNGADRTEEKLPLQTLNFHDPTFDKMRDLHKAITGSTKVGRFFRGFEDIKRKFSAIENELLDLTRLTADKKGYYQNALSIAYIFFQQHIENKAEQADYLSRIKAINEVINPSLGFTEIMRRYEEFCQIDIVQDITAFELAMAKLAELAKSLSTNLAMLSRREVQGCREMCMHVFESYMRLKVNAPLYPDDAAPEIILLGQFNRLCLCLSGQMRAFIKSRPENTPHAD